MKEKKEGKMTKFELKKSTIAKLNYLSMNKIKGGKKVDFDDDTGTVTPPPPPDGDGE